MSALLARLPRSVAVHDRTRALATAAAAITALATVLTPWFALDDYVPNGWDATWWARVAAIGAILAIVALRLRRDREAAVLALGTLACVAIRTIWAPDFGFDFDGLTVPTERRWGLYLALIAAAIATAAALRLATRSRVAAPEP